MSLPNYKINVFISVKAEDKTKIQHLVRIFYGNSSSGRICNPTITLLEKNHNVNPKFDSDYDFLLDSILKSNKYDNCECEPDEQNCFNGKNPNCQSVTESYTIICKDTAISVCTAQTLYDMIEKSIDLSKESKEDFDILYLGKWMDKCDKYTNVRNVGERGLKLVDTVSPNGVLCMMFTPSGKNKFFDTFDPKTNPILKATLKSPKTLGHYLNSMISNRKENNNKTVFYATTFTPNLINFNVIDRINDKELIKTIECQEVPSVKTSNIKKISSIKNLPATPITKKSSNMSFFWFVIVILFVLLAAWIIITYTSVKNPDGDGDRVPKQSLTPFST